MNARESLFPFRFLMSASASVPGTSLDKVSVVVNGVALTPRFYWPKYVDLAWGLSG